MLMTFFLTAIAAITGKLFFGGLLIRVRDRDRVGDGAGNGLRARANVRDKGRQMRRRASFKIFNKL